MNNSSGPSINNAQPGASIDRLLSRRSSTLNECSEERVIEERLLEAYDREMMDPKDHWEQEHVNELEGMAALERLALVQDAAEQSQLIRVLEASEDEEHQKHQQRAAEWHQTQLREIENPSVSQSFDLVLDHMEQMQQIDQMEQSQEVRHQTRYNHDQEQLEQWEHGDLTDEQKRENEWTSRT